jgi:hypothetical protein
VERKRKEGVGVERRESENLLQRPRERKGKDYEDILSQNHINIPLTCNYHYALA